MHPYRICSALYSLSLLSSSLPPSHPPRLSPRGPSGTAGETLPHRDRATGSEDQGLSERVLLWSVIGETQLHIFHIF